MDCPRCRLLFTPTTDDVSNPRGRADDIAAERAWAEDNVPRPYPSPNPYAWRRRYRWLTDSEFGLVLVACVVMLILAAVVVGIYTVTVIGVGPPRIAPVTDTAPPAVTAPAPAEPPPSAPPPPPLANDAEIEDVLPPKKPVPRIDD
jgi:hypothetical protein